MTLHSKGHLLETLGCSMPLYDPHHWTIKRAFIKDAPYQNACASRTPTVLIQKLDRVILDTGALRRGYNVSEQEFSCQYREVFRDIHATVPDATISFGQATPLHFNRTLNGEFVEVSCQASGKPLFTEHFLIPRRRHPVDLRQRQVPRQNSASLSVLILGIDSTSRMNFHRHMEETRRYLVEELNAFEFVGLNKVGDSSFPNLMPLLTGLSAAEAESLYTRLGSFDDFPLLWTPYRRKGYRTLYLEEMPHYSLFTYPNFTGFLSAPPADYYPVPVLRLLDGNGDDRYCAGSRLKTAVFIDYLKDVLKYNRGRSMFSFVWLSDLTHNHMKGLKILDAMLASFLRELYTAGVLNDTALLFLSDHGPRIGPYRMAEIGRYEDKNPFCFLALPERFLAAHPKAATQLQVNQRRLITHYDLHATLLSLSGLPDLHSLPTDKGLNLFGRIPSERTCADAFIGLEFCACLDARDKLDTSKVSLSFSRYAVAYINALARLNFPGKCVNWELDAVNEASVLGGRVAGKVVLRVVISTVPMAHFEVYGVLLNESSWEKRVDLVQRLDRYSNQTKCLPNSRWQKICMCREEVQKA
ncbi:uncharacterized protein LOC144143177 [Haemaphysalis longicornis]